MAKRSIDNSIDNSWAAGFFDGEGCVNRTCSSKKCIALRIGQSHLSVLRRFKKIFRVGKIYGPYVAKPIGNYKCKPKYMYQVAKFDKVKMIITKIWPYLDKVKREQILDLIS